MTDRPITVRAAALADLAAVAEIDREAFGAEPYPPMFFRQAHDLWSDLLRVAALPDGEVTGYVLAAPSLWRAEGWILSAAVAARHRGLGIATRLTRSILDALAAHGFSRARLTVHPQNLGAVALYRKLGFRARSEDAAYFGPGEPRLLMEADLAAADAPPAPPAHTGAAPAPARIRAKAVCVCRRGGDVLLGAAVDAAKGETFYGPPGGGVEFGERAEDAVRREMMEELGAELDDVSLLGVLENVFTYEGRPGHEIAFVFQARLRDPALYTADEIAGTEGGRPYVVHWMPLAAFTPAGPPLYPDGLLALLLSGAG